MPPCERAAVGRRGPARNGPKSRRGYLALASIGVHRKRLLFLVRLFGGLPNPVSHVFARVLNAATTPFH